MSSTKQLPELEALRGIAAVVVLVHHFMLGFTPRFEGLLYPDQPYSLMGTPAFAFINGAAAVIIFFVLSGFVLTVKIFQADSVAGVIPSLIKRWPRLALTVIVANLIAGIAMAFGAFANVKAAQAVSSTWLGSYFTWPSQGAGEISLALVEGATTFFTGRETYNSNLWTMYYEFIGSVVAICSAAAVVLIKHRFWKTMLLPLIWCICFYYSPRISTFIVGVWLAQMYSRGHKSQLIGWPVLLICALAVFLLGYHENLVSTRAEGIYALLNPLATKFPIAVRAVLHSIAAVCVISIVQHNAAIKRMMSGRFGQWLGYMSFAIYLVQITVICSISSDTFIALAGASQLVRICLTFVVTVAATFALAAPLAILDHWWVRTLNRWVRRSESRLLARSIEKPV